MGTYSPIKTTEIIDPQEQLKTKDTGTKSAKREKIIIPYYFRGNTPYYCLRAKDGKILYVPLA